MTNTDNLLISKIKEYQVENEKLKERNIELEGKLEISEKWRASLENTIYEMRNSLESLRKEWAEKFEFLTNELHKAKTELQIERKKTARLERLKSKLDNVWETGLFLKSRAEEAESRFHSVVEGIGSDNLNEKEMKCLSKDKDDRIGEYEQYKNKIEEIKQLVGEMNIVDKEFDLPKQQGEQSSNNDNKLENDGLEENNTVKEVVKNVLESVENTVASILQTNS